MKQNLHKRLQGVTFSYKYLLVPLFFFLLSAFGAQAQTVTSDKEDYAPGEVAIITGSGWTNDQFVDVHFEEMPVYHEEHQHDYHGIAVDVNGNWTIKYQIEERHLGVAFEVHVVGKQSGAEAYTNFTDAAVVFKASGLPDPTKVTVTSISYTIKNGNSTSIFTDTDKSFDAPNKNETTTHSAVENNNVYFTYPKSITKSDGLIYTLEDNDVTASYPLNGNKGTQDVPVTYDSKTKKWTLTAAKEVITVTAAYKLSISPTSLSVGSATGTYGGTTTLTATLKSGNTNLSGKTVNFSLNGGSAISATTDANGVATLSNVSLGTITAGTYATGVTASFAGDASYSSSNGSTSLTVEKAALTVTTDAKNRVYGDANPDFTGSVTGIKNSDDITATYASAATAASPVGTYAITATLADPTSKLGNYTVTNAGNILTVTQSPATITVAGLAKTYNGSAQGATVTTSPEGLAVNVTYEGSATVPTAAGSYAVVAALNNSNYSAANGTGTLVIAKAPTATVVTVGNATYDGSAHGGTASVTGAGGLDQAVAVSYAGTGTTTYSSTTAPTNAGTYTATATYAESANHLGSSDSKAFTINKATATLQLANLTHTYDGSIKSATATTSPAELTGVSISNNGKTDAGTYVVTASLDNTNYEATSVTSNLVIGKADQVITWSNPANIVYGTALSATQLNATALGGAVLTYTPAAGQVLDAGTQMLSVNAAEASNYKAASKEVTLVVEKANAVVSVEGKKVTYDGKAHGATGTAKGVNGEDLNSLLSLGASFTYVPGGSAEWTFSGDNNYNGAKGSVEIAIAKAAATVVVTGKTVTYDGQAHGATGTAKGVNDEALTGLSLGESFTNVPGGTASWSFTNANYADQSGTAAIVINKAATATVVTITGAPFTYTGVAQTPATVRVTGAGGLDLAPAAEYSNNVNAGTATASYSYAGGDNHEASSDSKAFEIGKRAVTITADAKSKFCGQADPALTYQVTAGSVVDSDVLTGSLSRTTGEIVGTYAISSTLANSNYAITYVGANFEIKGINVNSSDASTPRDYSLPISIKVVVKDGPTSEAKAVPSVPVTITLNGQSYSSTTDANGNATFAIGTLAVGVYKIAVNAGSCYSAEEYLPVYDPNGGFVTGGGWIWSPRNTALPYMQDEGRANFGFVAKYKKGSNTVEGNTEFQYQTGNLNFKSSNHTAGTLVISGGFKASFKGEGFIGSDLTVYQFMVVATDGQASGGNGTDDRFRMKIWNKATQEIVYDNQAGDENAELSAQTIIRGGSIVIHEVKTATNQKKVETAEVVLAETATELYNYPNAFSDRTTIAFSLDKADSFSLEIFDLKGSLIRKVSAGTAEAKQLYEYDVDGRNLAEGIYIARLSTTAGAKSLKMVLKK